jgi:hypothetical protein
VKNVLLAALGDRQKIAAVCAENEGSDGSHCCSLSGVVCAGMVVCLINVVGWVFCCFRSKQFAMGGDFKIYNGPADDRWDGKRWQLIGRWKICSWQAKLGSGNAATMNLKAGAG